MEEEETLCRHARNKDFAKSEGFLAKQSHLLCCLCGSFSMSAPSRTNEDASPPIFPSLTVLYD